MATNFDQALVRLEAKILRQRAALCCNPQEARLLVAKAELLDSLPEAGSIVELPPDTPSCSEPVYTRVEAAAVFAGGMVFGACLCALGFFISL